MNYFKKIMFCLIVFFTPVAVFASGFNSYLGEVSLGGFIFDPSGTHSYSEGAPGTSMDLENGLNISDDKSYFAKLKINNFSHLPGVYVSGLYMNSEGENMKSFTYGGELFDDPSGFNSEIEILNYDLTVFYSLKGFERATLGKLNVELGLSARWIEATGKISQTGTSVSVTEKDYSMGFFASFAGKPTDNIELYLQWKGFCFTDVEFTNLTAGARLDLLGSFFVGGGYMIEEVDIDQNGFKLDMESKGVFVEAGMRF
ncbi:MAG: hypothetical protein RBR53_11440 [Desulforegulaceae bacterium]|nr:hypothetical protein [Desulforegulaceae bacterium]